MNYEEIPYEYAHCYATAAKRDRCESCLHHQVAMMNESLATPHEEAMCITAAYIDKVASGTPCTHYRSNVPLRYACGMEGLFDLVPKSLYPDLRHRVMDCFSSERAFYYAQNGKQLISPDTQQSIIREFEQAGLPAPVFTHLELRVNW